MWFNRRRLSSALAAIMGGFYRENTPHYRKCTILMQGSVKSGCIWGYSTVFIPYPNLLCGGSVMKNTWFGFSRAKLVKGSFVAVLGALFFTLASAMAYADGFIINLTVQPNGDLWVNAQWENESIDDIQTSWESYTVDSPDINFNATSWYAPGLVKIPSYEWNTGDNVSSIAYRNGSYVNSSSATAPQHP